MIKIEKTLLFIIVLVLLVGAVSATETLREDQTNAIDETVASDISIVSQDNNKILNNEEKKVLDENPQKNVEYTTHNIEKKSDNNLKKEGIVKVHNYTELQNAVNNASSAGADTTIRLLQGSYNNTGTITWNTGGIVLTIDGNGQTINGQQQQVFYIDGASMILKNIIITNAKYSNGGAIHNYYGSTLTVSNSTFNNNQATMDGGAINNYYGSTLTVSNSTFNNNQATGDGGAINNLQGTLTVSNSTFNNNQATMDGGAIYDASSNIWTNMISSNFTNNTALKGAAIYAYGSVNLTNNTFKENTATNNKETIDLYGYWNGLFEGNTYESTDIALNEISLNLKDDQSIYTTDEDVILNFTIQPTNTNYYYDYETGIQDITLYINGQKNITTKYENYTLSGLEPGEYEVYFTSCNRQSNTVTFKVMCDAEVNVTNYTQLVQAIANATREEYNIYKINLQPGDYNATTSINWENSATKKIIINGNNNTLNGQNTHRFIKINSGHNLTLENITITNYTSGYGGAIYNYYGYLTITNSKFTNNQATDEGGAIYDDSKNKLTNIISSNFINNTAPEGAAIKAFGWINLTNNTFNKNTATDNNETIDLTGWWNGLFEDNIYESTDIALNEIKLSLKDDQNTYTTDEDVILNFTITPTNTNYYFDYQTGIQDITLYINGQKNITTKYENYTLSGLEPGEYEVYYTSCNRQSNTVTFKVIGDAEVNVTNYTQLVQAIENATNNPYTSYKINLQPGDYNATTSINWENSATKKIIINGNNNTLNGQHTHQFIKINSGHNLTLENITITNYTSGYGGAIYNQGILTVTDATFTNNTANTGGAIYNYYGLLTITNTRFKNNQINKYGGAIYNYNGYLTITNSQFLNNQAFDGIGGAICDDSRNKLTNITSSNFINNTASNGSAITAFGLINLTNNTFKQNTATNNTETIDLNGWWNGKHEDNLYESTDIALNEIKLTIKDDQETFQQDEDIILNYTIQLTNTNYYFDFETGINDITLYINGEKNKTTQYENTTIKDLPAGKYEIYYTTCNQKSNTVTFKVIGDSQITTPEESYEYYEGVNNKIPLIITDPGGEKGTINITIKDQDEYKQLFTYYNIGDGYELPTESLASALENIYNPLSDSYTINIIYSSDCTNPSSTEFTLNINKQRNTTITYDILNNTEGNVQINITVQDAVYKTPIADATIQITGDINTDTTSGILTDNTLTPGDYTINVEYTETEDYKASQTTIDFTVEIDKDKKIAELEGQVENLTKKLEQANEKIENLTNQLEQANNEIETLNNNITNLTTQLEEAENKISTLNNTIENITQQLEQAQEEIETLNNTNNNLTTQLEEANQKIDSLNNQLSNITQKIKEKDNQIENLTEQITDLTKQLQDAQKEIQTLTQENNNLNNQLEQAQQTIKTLNNTIKELTRPPLNTTITITPIKSSVGSILNLSANVKDQNGEKVSGGKVIFKVNGITLKDEYNNVLYATLTDGLATLKYKVQAAWMKNTSYVEAVYGGNENYTSSRTKSSNIINITEGTAKVSLDKSSFTVKSGETITLRAKIVDANGDTINRGKVVFKLNGKTLTDKNGKTLQANVTGGEAILEYTIPSTYSSRTYNLTAVYGGEGYTRSQTTGKLTINKKGVTINTDSITTKNNKTTLKATITDETGELLVRNTNLAIKANGITILNGVNSTNGKIDLSFTTTLRPGMYELQIISGENGIYKTGKMTTVLKI